MIDGADGEPPNAARMLPRARNGCIVKLPLGAFFHAAATENDPSILGMESEDPLPPITSVAASSPSQCRSSIGVSIPTGGGRGVGSCPASLAS